ncbi:MAG: autoinducer binding domain-containing protein [Micropepsaceae bacterium]
MNAVLADAHALIERCTQANSPAEIGQAFYNVVRKFGAKSLVVADRHGEITRHFTLEGPEGWYDYYFKHDLRRGNPVFRNLRRRSTGFVWSEIDDRCAGDQRWFDALDEFEMPDGMSVPSHGPNGQLGWISFTAEEIDMGPVERQAIALAGLALQDRLRVLAGAIDAPVSLSDRERDCLGFVAQGKSDWEISVILSISQSTVHTHVENAKRKLSARTRAQAVARFICQGLA